MRSKVFDAGLFVSKCGAKEKTEVIASQKKRRCTTCEDVPIAKALKEPNTESHSSFPTVDRLIFPYQLLSAKKKKKTILALPLSLCSALKFE